MRYSTGLLLTAAGLAAAQTTTSTSTTNSSSATPSAYSGFQNGCGVQIDKFVQTTGSLRERELTVWRSIIQLCVTNNNAILQTCASTDYSCLCTAQTNVVICYNNCPASPNKPGAVGTQVSPSRLVSLAKPSRRSAPLELLLMSANISSSEQLL